MPIVASVAGTKHPAWAITVIMPRVDSTVDLPAMFGPVIIISLASSLEVTMSFGTTFDLPSLSSSTGCLPPYICVSARSAILGRVYLEDTATSAKPAHMSISAAALADASILGMNFPTSSLTEANISRSSFKSLSSAPTILDSSSFNSGVMYLSALARVCFLM